jgi:hypothetical protein
MESGTARNRNEPLVMCVGLHADGATYELDVLSADRVQEQFPRAEGLPTVFFGYNKREEFERRHGRLWELAARLLTGLTMKQIGQMGGIRLEYPRTDQVFWEWRPKTVKSK